MRTFGKVILREAEFFPPLPDDEAEIFLYVHLCCNVKSVETGRTFQAFGKPEAGGPRSTDNLTEKTSVLNIRTMALTKAKKLVVFGVIAAVLGLVALTLFLERHNIADRLTIAGGERAMAKRIATPLDLSAHYAHPAFDDGSTSGYWADVPWRFQVFRGVPLQIDGLMYLWGQGNAQRGADFPEEILGIPVNQKFETLYVYHCAFFSSLNNAPVYNLVFRYDDGSSATNQILYGRDILDFNSKGNQTGPRPSGSNSKLAWVGASFTGDGTHPLRFILTALDNPQPNSTVTSIDLYSCKGRSAACVLAMTAGKSGLMK